MCCEWLYIYIYIYDRNSNLNLHIRIFWKSRGSNPHPHKWVRLFENGDYDWAEYLSSILWMIIMLLHFVVSKMCFGYWPRTTKKQGKLINVLSYPVRHGKLTQKSFGYMCITYIFDNTLHQLFVDIYKDHHEVLTIYLFWGCRRGYVGNNLEIFCSKKKKKM